MASDGYSWTKYGCHYQDLAYRIEGTYLTTPAENSWTGSISPPFPSFAFMILNAAIVIAMAMNTVLSPNSHSDVRSQRSPLLAFFHSTTRWNVGFDADLEYTWVEVHNINPAFMHFHRHQIYRWSSASKGSAYINGRTTIN